MRPQLVIIAIVGLLVGAGDAGKMNSRKATDETKLQGEWLVTETYEDGQKVTDEKKIKRLVSPQC